MHQPTLFDEQAVQLARVRSRIAALVLAFCTPGRTFRMEELTRHVLAGEPGTAPDSPSRILRALKLEGLVRYRVLNRRGSLYRVEG
jgi:hypothetical protein